MDMEALLEIVIIVVGLLFIPEGWLHISPGCSVTPDEAIAKLGKSRLLRDFLNEGKKYKNGKPFR